MLEKFYISEEGRQELKPIELMSLEELDALATTVKCVHRDIRIGCAYWGKISEIPFKLLKELPAPQTQHYQELLNFAIKVCTEKHATQRKECEELLEKARRKSLTELVAVLEDMITKIPELHEYTFMDAYIRDKNMNEVQKALNGK